MLPKEAIEEFKQLWAKEYGREINNAQAEKIAIKLLLMMKAIYKPVRMQSKIFLDNLLKQQEQYGKSSK